MLASTRHPRVLPISLILLLVLTPQCLAAPDPIAKALPEALPIPGPIPEAAPLPSPIAAPAPRPEPKAEAEPDGGGNVYQFSGAIYVNGNGGGYQSQGGSYQSASAAVCPGSAPISCTSIGQPNWYVFGVISNGRTEANRLHCNRCCPSGNTCGWASNQVVGCCPSGESCSGTIGGYNQGG